LKKLVVTFTHDDIQIMLSIKWALNSTTYWEKDATTCWGKLERKRVMTLMQRKLGFVMEQRVQSAYASCDISQTTYRTLLHPLSFISLQGTTFFACNCHQPAVAHCYLKACHHTCKSQSCMQCQPSADQEKQTLLNRYDPSPTSQPSASCSLPAEKHELISPGRTWLLLTSASKGSWLAAECPTMTAAKGWLEHVSRQAASLSMSAFENPSRVSVCTTCQQSPCQSSFYRVARS